MVAVVVFLCCRAAPIAASMAVLGQGSDRPAADRPAASRRTAADGFFVPRGMSPFRGRGQKPTQPLRKAIEAEPPLGPNPPRPPPVGRCARDGKRTALVEGRLQRSVLAPASLLSCRPDPAGSRCPMA